MTWAWVSRLEFELLLQKELSQLNSVRFVCILLVSCGNHCMPSKCHILFVYLFCRLDSMYLVEVPCCHQQLLCLVFQLRLQVVRKLFWPHLPNKMDQCPLRFFTLQRKLEFLKYYLQVNWPFIAQFQKISMQCCSLVQYTDITEKKGEKVQTSKIINWKRDEKVEVFAQLCHCNLIKN